MPGIEHVWVQPQLVTQVRNRDLVQVRASVQTAKPSVLYAILIPAFEHPPQVAVIKALTTRLADPPRQDAWHFTETMGTRRQRCRILRVPTETMGTTAQRCRIMHYYAGFRSRSHRAMVPERRRSAAGSVNQAGSKSSCHRYDRPRPRPGVPDLFSRRPTAHAVGYHYAALAGCA